MTNPEQTPPPEDDGALVEAVLAMLAVGASVDATAKSLAAVLAVPFAIALEFLHALGKAALKAFRGATVKEKTPTAVGLAHRANLRYRAAFIIRALRRIVAAPDKKLALKRELEFWKGHLKANARRIAVARRIDWARGRYGELLGWYAKMDDRTSAECRAADGRNFVALEPPVIGYPGSVHLHCRCVPGPPHPGAKMVNDSLTVRRSDAASGFHRRSV
ncbi:capsid maturation protease and MuF-like fusion protein [Streptomyces phage Araceli]|nr:capsid morphogenesis protein [Streptomyces phage Henoccus]AWY07327.1 capsid morphogenesis protein [Streptomyces phage JackieB]QFG07822.1 capsid maturation protease and MuF-like fusion protein [Streptomyces phage Araceli]